jgi:hypothetical protein
MLYVYGGWCVIEIVKLLLARRAPAAWTGFRKTLALRFAPSAD